MWQLKTGVVIVGISVALLSNASGEIESNAANEARNTYLREATNLMGKHLGGSIRAAK